MATKDVAIWQASQPFVAEGMTIQVGDTIAAGHPILKGREAFFEPFEPLYDHARDKARRNDQLKVDRAARKEALKAAKAEEAEAAEEAAEAEAEEPADTAGG